MSENVQTFSGKVNVADNLLVGTSHFFVDRQNNRVGIGTSTPDASSMLDVTGNIKSGGTITATGGFSGNGSGLSGVNSDSGSWVNGTNSNVHLATSTNKVGIGVVDPDEILDVIGNTRVTGMTYGLKLTGTLDSTRTSDWYRLLVGSNRDGGNAIRTKCILQVLASGLHETVTFDFNHMISLNYTSGSTFNLTGHDHYAGRNGVVKLRLVDITQATQVALDMYIDHNVVPVDRTWTVTLYVEGGSLISAPSTFLEKITATPTHNKIEFDIGTSLFGILGDQETESFVIKEDGNVGVGTVSPSAKLDVRGNIIGKGIAYNHKFYGGFSGNSSNSSTTYTDAESITYTPLDRDGAGFYIVCEAWFDWGAAGYFTDDFRVAIRNSGNTELDYMTPKFINQGGGGARYGHRNLLGYVTVNPGNANTQTFKLSHKRSSGDDANYVFKATLKFKVYQILI